MGSEKEKPDQFAAPGTERELQGAAPEGNGGLIDLSYLLEIARTNKNFINEVLDLFVSHIPQELSDLDRAIDRADHAHIRTLAHKIKSSLPFVGLDKTIGHLLEEMEELGETGDGLAHARAMFHRVNADCLRVIEEIPSKRP